MPNKKKIDCLKLINSIEKSLEFKKFIRPQTKILLAYSGGQDSNTLLAIFYILSKKWKFKLGLVYCNHGWFQSNEAILNIFKVLQKYKIPFYFVDIPFGISQKPENVARQWRYNAFEKIKNKGNYNFVLTGHTLSDKAETILFNLARGSGLKGVSSLKLIQKFNNLQKGDYQFQYKTMICLDFQLFFFKNFELNLGYMNFYHLFNLYSLKCYQKKLKKLNFSTNNWNLTPYWLNPNWINNKWKQQKILDYCYDISINNYKQKKNKKKF